MQLIECPRDAMQGWPSFINTELKIAYINQLLQVGFDTIDAGSFVSAKAIPQMADTSEVIKKLELKNSTSKILTIVANKRGAETAVEFDEISYIGFPFSISPTFQQRNTNSSIEESVERLNDIQDLCIQKNKQLVVYLSMAFGNPYGDTYNDELLLYWANTMATKQIPIVSLADTVGVATPLQITTALQTLIPAYSTIQFGVHLHSSPLNFTEKLQAAINAGCTRIDGALKGIGGCPMAQDNLVGNMDTEQIIHYLEEQQHSISINKQALAKAVLMASHIFN